MRSNRLKMVAAATVGAVALSVTSLAGTAQADLADDVAIMVDNVPAAVQTLIDAGQTTVNTYLATNSFEQTNMAALGGVVQTANALAAGTEQFGSLGLGVALGLGGPYSVLQPYLQAFDADPASVVDMLDPNDIATILANLPTAVQTAQPALVDAVTELLRGNLTEGTGFFGGTGTPAVVGSSAEGIVALLTELSRNTSFEFTLPLGIGAPLLVAAIATAGYVKQVEDGVAPVFEALAPVTDPIIVALEGL